VCLVNDRERETDRQTDRSGSVERLLQLCDELLVLVAVGLQLFDAPSQQSHLGLKVRQLLVLSLELLTSISSCTPRLLQPARNKQT